MATNRTGGDIDAYCTKCKLVLAHIIIAMKATRVMRVECKTCRGVHAYRKQARAASTTRTPRKSTRGVNGPAAYEQLIAGQDMSRAVGYKIANLYASGDILDHASFGLGLVTRELADRKIEVAFPNGTKVLVHARA